jgi:NTP pyrophosphatase (non-canonical NTP hydrolase)
MTDKEKWLDYQNRISMGLGLQGEQTNWVFDKALQAIEGEKMINNYCKEAYLIAKSKGWHDEPREMGTILALIHSEVSEALEADRKGNYENFVEELADVCIRVFDLCGAKDIDLETAISKKMQYNRTRSYKHGGKAY